MAREMFDVLVIGSGLSSLTGAALLAKRGLRVLCVEQHTQPGGSCGTFKVGGRTVDQGTSMFFGFGQEGFNPHRYVMNVLREPIVVIRHRHMYRLVYDGHPIEFHADFDAYFDSLATLFDQAEMDGIKRFYRYIGDLYHHVIAADTTYMAPTEVPKGEAFTRFLRHPVRNLRLFPLLSKSAGDLLRSFVDTERVVRFFSKLTSTYCYTTLDETPAILAITMFMENHTGGSYYAAGGSHQLPGKLEKAFERFGGTIRYRSKAVRLLFDGGVPNGALIVDDHGSYEVLAKRILHGGTLYNLHACLIDEMHRDKAVLRRVQSLKMSYPSVVLYCIIDKEALPEGTLPIEMFADNPVALDEKEVTMYAFSFADPSLCAADEHVVMAIGPSLRMWPNPGGRAQWNDRYEAQKEQEIERLLGVLDLHFPGFRPHVRHVLLATPTTIERFTMKENGCVAGPKQAMGQELLNRQRARGMFPTLYHCGEATVMGTGSPAVTISGISAVNVILRDCRLEEYRLRRPLDDMVSVIEEKVVTVRVSGDGRRLPTANAIDDPQALELHDLASACQWCLDAPCMRACLAHYEIPAIMRRLECGNVFGARRQLLQDDGGTGTACADCAAPCTDVCTSRSVFGHAVEIDRVLASVAAMEVVPPCVVC